MQATLDFISLLRRSDLRVHDIRHWVAASLLRNGVASQILGHRDQTMLLRRFGHLDHMSLLDAQQDRWQSFSESAERWLCWETDQKL